jgi:aminopeptidase
VNFRVRGAYALIRLNYASIASEWFNHAPIELIEKAAAIDQVQLDTMDAYFVITAPENKWDGSDVPAERMELYEKHWWRQVHGEVRIPKTRCWQ